MPQGSTPLPKSSFTAKVKIQCVLAAGYFSLAGASAVLLAEHRSLVVPAIVIAVSAIRGIDNIRRALKGAYAAGMAAHTVNVQTQQSGAGNAETKTTGFDAEHLVA